MIAIMLLQSSAEEGNHADQFPDKLLSNLSDVHLTWILLFCIFLFPTHHRTDSCKEKRKQHEWSLDKSNPGLSGTKNSRYYLYQLHFFPLSTIVHLGHPVSVI